MSKANELGTELECLDCEVRWRNVKDDTCWLCGRVGLPWYMVARTRDEKADLALAKLLAGVVAPNLREQTNH